MLEDAILVLTIPFVILMGIAGILYVLMIPLFLLGCLATVMEIVLGKERYKRWSYRRHQTR